MDRAGKVAAEPRMDDLLASIKRAIHDEGLELTGPVAGDELGELLDPVENPPKSAPVERSNDTVENRRGSDSQQIIALRNKISRELNKEETVPAAPPQGRKPVPLRQPQLVQPSVTQFKTLLGGDEAPSSLRQAPRLVSSRTKEAKPPQAPDRQSRLPAAPQNPAAAHPLRSAFDVPDRHGSADRPPFGQGNLGIRGYQPPPEGMLSPKTSQVAASSFNRLAEQMFGREGGERSIDDLAREVLRPMLKQWLDENLPRIVEQLVREEIERVARRSGR
jgi:cell pole-organizing protein PopZ